MEHCLPTKRLFAHVIDGGSQEAPWGLLGTKFSMQYIDVPKKHPPGAF